MIDEALDEFFGDKEIKEKVEAMWSSVMDASRKFILDSEKFGFETIAFVPNPNIHKIVSSLTAIDLLLGLVISDLEESKLDHSSDIRLAYNAKQQILNMKRVASALNNKDRGSYEEAVKLMNGQACI